MNIWRMLLIIVKYRWLQKNIHRFKRPSKMIYNLDDNQKENK